MWGERGTSRLVQLVKLGWIKVCEKAGLPDYLDHLDQRKYKTKKNGQLWYVIAC